MSALPRLRAGVPGLAAFAAVLVLAACNSTAPQGGDGGGDGGGGGGGPVVCSSSSDCPSATPVCSGGVCVAKSASGCTTDADCDGGTCDTLTGQCSGGGGGTSCTKPSDCAANQVCSNGTCTASGGTSCTTANDCKVNEICQQGTCVAFDPNAACTSDADCPRDHVCNTLGGTCQGCLNDNSCVGSPNGPKCDTGGGAGPGAGYCYKECGADVNRDCPKGQYCDASKGGLCVPSCSTNADCTGGLICKGTPGQCQACTADAQCDLGQVCGKTGTCVTKPTCTDAQCQGLGQAYYCDTTSETCQLGCSPAGCSGATKDCNPCPSNQTCDTTTHTCSGGSTCDCTSLNCSAQGDVCDSTNCQCVAPSGGGGGSGAIGDPCLQDSDCTQVAGQTVVCNGAVAFIGLKGTCQIQCSQANSCACPSGQQCVSLGQDGGVGYVACALGVSGVCQ